MYKYLKLNMNDTVDCLSLYYAVFYKVKLYRIEVSSCCYLLHFCITSLHFIRT